MTSDMDTPYYAKERPEVVPFLPPAPTRVLEVGCSEGRFRANLPKTCEYRGVELSAEVARVAAKVLDAVLVGRYDDVASDLPAHYFDLVICNDVIEHMADHDAFLEGIKQKMVRGAHLVGSVPNVRYLPHLVQLLTRREWRYAESGLLDRTHLRFFTERSWQRTLREHGFLVEAMAGINGVNPGATWSRRLAKRAAITVLGADTRFLQFGFRARVGPAAEAARPSSSTGARY
jgi:2-polyprenyl-3-methyl-5-hydroxy-6-metoxy-1,4-benzoquinol methylase